MSRRHLVSSPASLSRAEAAPLPLAGLTAWQALVDTARVAAGQRVLIHGAGGGVGHLAVQITRSRGAHVTGTASAAKHDFVASLGADELIDYRATDFAAHVDGVDVVLDTIGGDTARLLGIPAASATTSAARSTVRAPADQGPITVSLTATRSDGGNPLHPQPGQTITLTATTNIDVGPTPYFIEIYNSFGMNLLNACGGGTTCSADVTENSPIASGEIAFVAYVADFSQSLEPPDVQASTADNPFEPSWLYPLTLTAYRSAGVGVTLDFTDGGDTTHAPWYIQLYDENKNEVVAWCAMTYGCFSAVGWEGDYPNPFDVGCHCGYVGTSDSSYSSDTFCAVLAPYSTIWPPPDIRDWANHPV